jgi:hypothetical protein
MRLYFGQNSFPVQHWKSFPFNFMVLTKFFWTKFLAVFPLRLSVMIQVSGQEKKFCLFVDSVIWFWNLLVNWFVFWTITECFVCYEKPEFLCFQLSTRLVLNFIMQFIYFYFSFLGKFIRFRLIFLGIEGFILSFQSRNWFYAPTFFFNTHLLYFQSLEAFFVILFHWFLYYIRLKYCFPSYYYPWIWFKSINKTFAIIKNTAKLKFWRQIYKNDWFKQINWTSQYYKKIQFITQMNST